MLGNCGLRIAGEQENCDECCYNTNAKSLYNKYNRSQRDTKSGGINHMSSGFSRRKYIDSVIKFACNFKPEQLRFGLSKFLKQIKFETGIKGK